MIRALFFDIDGTLLSFRTHRIPDSALRALRAAQARGVKIFIATGRSSQDLGHIREVPYDGVAALNGADCVLRSGERLVRHTVPPEYFAQVVELSRSCGFGLALELDEGFFVDRLTPEMVEWARLVAHSVPEEADLEECYARYGCSQMCFFFDEAMEREVMARLPMLEATRWCSLFANINLRGVDKGTGLEVLASHFGIAPEQTMAFGDGGNDVAMLRRAGIGVAMGNACEQALRAADHVTADVDDHGVWRALARFGVIDPREVPLEPGEE